MPIQVLFTFNTKNINERHLTICLHKHTQTHPHETLKEFIHFCKFKTLNNVSKIP